MLKIIALSLALTQPLFAQTYGDIVQGDLDHLFDCVEICREYKQCVSDGNGSRSRELFLQFWKTCSANPKYNWPDLIWVGGSFWCPDPKEYPSLYSNVNC